MNKQQLMLIMGFEVLFIGFVASTQYGEDFALVYALCSLVMIIIIIGLAIAYYELGSMEKD